MTGASRTGARHARCGRGNQDAIGWTALDRTIAAVADGHGAAVHHRSHRGAAFAVAEALQVLARCEGGAVATLPDALLRGWRDRVLADMARDPVAGDVVPGAALAPYGTTLLAVVAGDDGIVAVQIGDGDLLLVDAAGGVMRPLTVDDGLAGEQTYSLCQDHAARHFRVARLPVAGPRAPVAAVLATDGVGKSLGGAIDAAVRDLVDGARVTFDAVAAALPDWLDRVSRDGTGDDASLCLLLRGDPAA